MRVPKFFGLLLAGAAFVLPARLGATTVNVTLLPGYAGNTNVAGNAANSAPGYPTGSWQGPGNATKSESYVPASALFANPVTINDIASVSYWTNKGTTAQAPDWTFLIYTAKTGSGDTGSFYHTRLNSEPYLTGTPAVGAGSVPANTWHQWSTGDLTHPMRFYDANRNGGILGTYTDPTLADLQAGPISWPAAQTYDYRTSADVISLFSLQTGSGWANGFTGMVDGMSISLKNGDVANINLEAAVVPLPPTVWMGITLMAGMVGIHAYKRYTLKAQLA